MLVEEQTEYQCLCPQSLPFTRWTGHGRKECKSPSGDREEGGTAVMGKFLVPGEP